MKSLKTKVLLSAIVLMFALVATIGSTYAWFTVSQTVSVQSMTLNVQAADSLLIKVLDPTDPTGASSDINVPSTYKTTLTLADINAVDHAYNGIETWKLYPVTAVQTGYASVDGNTAVLNALSGTGNLRALTPISYISLTSDADNVNDTDADGKVIQIAFWVMSQSINEQDLYLSNLTISADNAIESRDTVVNAVRLSVALATDGAFGTAPADAKIAGAVDLEYSYEYQRNLPEFADLFYWDTLGAGLDDLISIDGEMNYTFNDDAVDYWTQGAGSTHYLLDGTGLYEEGNATNIVAPIANIYTTSALMVAAGFNRIDQMTAATHIDLIDNDVSHCAVVDTHVRSLSQANATFGQLTQNTPRAVIVTIFLEGWDAQTTNSIIAAMFDISFQFTIALHV